MKTIKYLYLIVPAAVTLLWGCYGGSDENYAALAKMTVTASSRTIEVNLGEPLITDITVTSENGLPITYEWSYGATTEFPKMLTNTIVSDKPEIDYVFPRIGTYVLRLRADNGESIVFEYFTLNVLSGLDEGIVVLSNDDEQAAHLTFIKKRTAAEEAADAQEVWYDIMGTINPDIPMSKATDMVMSTYFNANLGAYHSLVITTRDDHGTTFDLDPRTFELKANFKLADDVSGVKPHKVMGYYNASTIALYDLILGSDGNIYRFDLFESTIGLRSKLATPASYVYEGHNGTSASNYHMYFYSPSRIYCPGNGVLNQWTAPQDVNILSVAMPRTGTVKVHAITADKSDPRKITFYNLSATLASPSAGVTQTFTSTPPIAEGTTMITSASASDWAYYTYSNGIYRWNVANLVNPSLPTSPITLTPALPDGEQIISIGVSGKYKAAAPGEDYLYVATYNPNRSGKKGSLYVYKFSDHSLLKKYEGICDKPVRVLYKYIC